MSAVPKHLSGRPPVVSYTYSKTIAGKIFNHRKVVEQMNMDDGTTHLQYNCNSSNYKYEACGHIVTGDLNIIKDVKLRNI